MIRDLRYQKKKIIGGNLLKNVYDRVKGIISTGSKIINRIPTGVRSELKKLVVPMLANKVPIGADKFLSNLPSDKLNDRSRAILSNLIAGSGFKNYID